MKAREHLFYVLSVLLWIDMLALLAGAAVYWSLR